MMYQIVGGLMILITQILAMFIDSRINEGRNIGVIMMIAVVGLWLL